MPGSQSKLFQGNGRGTNGRHLKACAGFVLFWPPPLLVRAHLYVGGAHIHKRALRGRAIRGTAPLPLRSKAKAPHLEPVLRGQRSCAEGNPSRMALLCREQSSADGAPVRRAVLRGQRPLQMLDIYRLQAIQTALLHEQYAGTASDFYPTRHTVSRQECFK